MPKAARKLLLHKSEIRKLFGLSSVKGNALFPLSFYWKNGRVKVALAVGKGKVAFDKREDLKKRDSDRELKRATMHRAKGQVASAQHDRKTKSEALPDFAFENIP